MVSRMVPFLEGLVWGCSIVALMLATITLVSKEENGLESREDMFAAVIRSSSPLVALEDEEQNRDKASYMEEAMDEMTKVDEIVAVSEEEMFESTFENPISRKSLLTIVVSSVSHIEKVSKTVRMMWDVEGTTNDYYIIVGNSGKKLINLPPHVIQFVHSDLSTFPYLTCKELSFLLATVKIYFVESYKWFLFVPGNTYVSVSHTQDFISGLDPYEIMYFGNPSESSKKESGYYCKAGPGVLLSHATLKAMDNSMWNCLKENRNDVLSDEVLGECVFDLLHIECQNITEISPENVFIHDAQVVSQDPSMLWTEKFTNMATLYPIRDTYQLEAVHAFNQARQIDYHQKKAKEILNTLRESDFCPNSVWECNSELVNNTSYKTSYKEFSQNCSLFYRGYIPELRRKVNNWDIVEKNTIYNSMKRSPQSLVNGWLSEELRFVTSVAMEIVREEAPDAELNNIASLYVRYKGTVGREFIIDLNLVRTKQGEAPLERRVALLLPHAPYFLFLEGSENLMPLSSVRINFIIPMDGLNRHKVSRFQRSFYGLCVKYRRNCRVIFVFYSDKGRDSKFMKHYLVRYSRKYSAYKYEFLVNPDKLDWEKAYNQGMSILKDNELVILADLELSMTSKSIDLCRETASLGKRIYYPLVFMYYNMQYIYRGRWRPRHYDFIRQHGHWARHYTVCLYKADYTAIGGYNTIRRWKEETDTLDLPGGVALDVIHSPDYGMSHLYEEKQCNPKLPIQVYSHCLTQHKDGVADKTDLASYVLELVNKCDKTRL